MGAVDERNALERARVLLVHHGGVGWADQGGRVVLCTLCDRALVPILMRRVLPAREQKGAEITPGSGGSEPKALAASPGQGGRAARGNKRALSSGPADTVAAILAVGLSGVESARFSGSGCSPPLKRHAACVPRDALEASLSLELLAAAQGWKWTVNVLIRQWLHPALATPDGGLGPALRLLGRLGWLAPTTDDTAVRWLRSSLGEVLREGELPRFSAAEQVAAATALIQLSPSWVTSVYGSSLAPAGVHEEAQLVLRVLRKWSALRPTAWRAMPVELRDRVAAAP